MTDMPWDDPSRIPKDVYWCSHCGVPLLQEECYSCDSHGIRVASDVRPVFPEEKRLLEIFLDYPEGSLRDESVWDTKSSNVIIGGDPVRMNKGELMTIEPDEIRHALPSASDRVAEANHKKTMERFVSANRARFQAIDYEAFSIINFAKERTRDALPVVSFSGGKDSTVVSDLVRRGYANQKILHVFGNTTLEFPQTLEYIDRFKNSNRRIPFLEARSQHSFPDLCKRIGPPSRVMRWCCTVFKTGPIGQRLDGLRDLNKPILTYYGIRRTESNQRSEYNTITRSPKISQQIVVSPIINWTDADVWLYIMTRRLDFNDAYRWGFSRIGCWCCPSNSLWSFFLTRIYLPDLAEPWRDYLLGFAKSIGKPDPVEYIDSGNWKARQGGQGLRTSYKGVLSSNFCGDDPYAKTYTLTRPICEELYEYFKPFGRLDFGQGRSILGEVFIVDKSTNDPVLILQGREGSKSLRVKAVDMSNPSLLLQRVDCQIRKFQACVLCGGCPSMCPRGAISSTAGTYRISEEKCVNCLRCISHFDTGCLVSKVLQTRKGAVI
jgi:phosphoadenosine phosphosulfate reductase